MKNFWKYPLIISGLSLVALLIYMLASLALYGNRKVSHYEHLWLSYTMLLFVFSLLWLIATSKPTIIRGIKEFLKD